MSNILITFLASFLIWFLFLGLAVLWLINGKIKQEQAMHAFYAALTSWAASTMLKSLIPTSRPFMTNGETPLTLTIPIDGSFPSAHTAIAFAIAMSVYLHNKRYGILFIVIATLVALGRVLSNVHYPLDVFAGVLIGVAVSFILEKLHFPLDD